LRAYRSHIRRGYANESRDLTELDTEDREVLEEEEVTREEEPRGRGRGQS
jgi:hypothetical protein